MRTYGTTNLQQLAAAPASPNKGDCYFDTVGNVAYVWNGTSWVAMQAGGAPGNMVTTDTVQTITASKTIAPTSDVVPLKLLRGTDSSPAQNVFTIRNHADTGDVFVVGWNGDIVGNSLACFTVNVRNATFGAFFGTDSTPVVIKRGTDASPTNPLLWVQNNAGSVTLDQIDPHGAFYVQPDADTTALTVRRGTDTSPAQNMLFLTNHAGNVALALVGPHGHTLINPDTDTATGLVVRRATDTGPVSNIIECTNQVGNVALAKIDSVGGLTASTAKAGGTAPTRTSRWVGGITGNAAPTSGTWVTGDWLLDDTGSIWVCTAGGTPGTWASETLIQTMPVVNALHNGDFQVWQRGTSGAGGASAAAPNGPDRWRAYRTGFAAGLTWSRQAGPVGFAYCCRVQRNSADTSTAPCWLAQSLLTMDSYVFQSQVSVVGFWARAGANYSAASSLLNVSVYSGTGTDQTADVTMTGSVTLVSANVTLTTSWQYFTVAVPAAGAAISQVQVRFSDTPVGTAGAADYFEVDGIQLEIGPVAHPIVRLDYQRELERCQFFYVRQNFVANQGMGMGTSYSTAGANITLYYPRMRAIPTAITISSQTAMLLYQAGTNSAPSAMSIIAGSPTESYAEWSVTRSTAMTAGQGAILRANGAIYIEISADL